MSFAAAYNPTVGGAKLAVRRRTVQVRHVQERARQRYRLELSEADVEALEAAIALGESRALRHNPHRHLVVVQGCVAVVVLRNGEIVTFLPQSAAPQVERVAFRRSTAAPG